MHELEKHENMHKRQRIKFSTTTIPGTGVQPVIMKSPLGLECPTMKVYGRFVEVQRVVLLSESGEANCYRQVAVLCSNLFRHVNVGC